jgi:hypothetical protein
MSTPCVRRWYTTWGTCPCPPCATEKARYRKHREAGLTTRITSGEAWTVLDRMIAQQWTNSAIASACNIPERSAYDLTRGHREGHRRVIGAVIAHRIVNHGRPTRGYVSALGSTRRLQALTAIGWTGDHIAAATDGAASRMTISYITRAERPTVRPEIADAIDDAYRAMHLTPGPSIHARRRAARHGWAPPAAWDAIDDPGDRPKGVLRSVEATSPQWSPSDALRAG